ncbi:MAG: hypothetical protein SOY06_10720 [Prevotella sp.]|nr:hypothetical protein [Bacteroidales bacterium]MDY4230300.1 hypothetical protein [Prevotella sp.]
MGKGHAAANKKAPAPIWISANKENDTKAEKMEMFLFKFRKFLELAELESTVTE